MMVYNKMTATSGFIAIPFEKVQSVRDGKCGLFVKAIIKATSN